MYVITYMYIWMDGWMHISLYKNITYRNIIAYIQEYFRYVAYYVKLYSQRGSSRKTKSMSNIILL